MALWGGVGRVRCERETGWYEGGGGKGRRRWRGGTTVELRRPPAVRAARGLGRERGEIATKGVRDEGRGREKLSSAVPGEGEKAEIDSARCTRTRGLIGCEL
ncbi:hypothetical protein Taro_005812 [Colocasia esculenta]|uniref:Uncharacterized protein n=1 Tax=Colocasia esculenta TaxID=4460 RepID=A0A843TQU0_COLES|nr:hypothetical protein [Colocasia esculenta]